MPEKGYKKWEQLKDENPWKDEIFNEDPEELRKKLLSGNAEFLHKDDAEIINKRNEKTTDNNKFKLCLLPEPFRGNLKDPKLVILSLNPGYNERVNKTLFKMLRPRYQKQFIQKSIDNALLKDGCRIISNNDVDNILDDGYWEDMLSDLKQNDVDISKIGLIQFIPYASKDYNSWKKEASLGTRQFSRDIILRLLYESPDTLFLVMRAKEQWEKLIKEMKEKEFEKRFLYNKHPRCQKLSQKNLMDGDENQFNNILKTLKR